MKCNKMIALVLSVLALNVHGVCAYDSSNSIKEGIKKQLEDRGIDTTSDYDKARAEANTYISKLKITNYTPKDVLDRVTNDVKGFFEHYGYKVTATYKKSDATNDAKGSLYILLSFDGGGFSTFYKEITMGVSQSVADKLSSWSDSQEINFDSYTGDKITIVTPKGVSMTIPVGDYNWIEEDGNWSLYNRSGQMLTGWQKELDKWFYFDSQGIMQTGWFKDTDGKWYFLNKDGSMACNTTVDGYVLNQSGACVR